MSGGEFTWYGWDAETDLGNDNDREGVDYLTIADTDGEELAVIVHRNFGDDRDVIIKRKKEDIADTIIKALQAYSN